MSGTGNRFRKILAFAGFVLLAAGLALQAFAIGAKRHMEADILGSIKGLDRVLADIDKAYEYDRQFRDYLSFSLGGILEFEASVRVVFFLYEAAYHIFPVLAMVLFLLSAIVLLPLFVHWYVSRRK